MNACQRGCTTTGQHKPDCTCTPECPNHDNHCRGCLPREAEVGGYCQRCAFQLRDNITTISDLINRVQTLPDGRLAPPDHTPGDDLTRRATRVDQHSPSPAYDTADEAARWINSWALFVADERSERGPFTYRLDGIPYPDPLAEGRYLTARLTHLTAAAYANDLYTEARQYVHELTRAAAADEGDQRIPLRCPSCNQRSLIRPNGQEYVTCRNRACGAAWSSDAYGILRKAAS